MATLPNQRRQYILPGAEVDPTMSVAEARFVKPTSATDTVPK